MKNIRFPDLHSKVYKGFLVSTFSLIFLVLNLTLIMTYRHITENMRAEEIRVLRNKLYTVAEDMDNQIDSMTNIVLRIVSWKIFRPDYIQESRYHAVEVLRQLKDYSDFSDISGDYFIKYEDDGRLFTSAGTTISPEFYFEKKQGIEDYSTILELLDALCQETRMGMRLYKEGDSTLFLYPLRVYSAGGNIHGVVGFLVTPADIDSRVGKIVGNIQGDMSLYYDDFCILGEEVQKVDERTVSIKMNDFQVCVQMDEDRYFSWKNVFSAREIMALVGVIVLMLALTVVAAWWNYLPFRKVITKYSSMFKGNFVMDWNDIDELIKSLLREKEMNSQLVGEQFQMLREQAIHLIVSGGYSERLQKRLTLLNIDLNYPIFGIIRVSFQKEQNTEGWREDLCWSIEELSEKGCCLYSYWDSDRTLRILAAADEEYEMVESVELLQSLFEAKELSAEVELCSVCQDLNQLHLLKREADQEHGKNSGKAEQGNPDEGQRKAALQQGKTFDKQKNPSFSGDKGKHEREQGKARSSIRDVVEYIEAHCTDYNLSLDMIARQAQITPQYLCVKLKAEIGMSYKEYLTQLRIEAAKRMLTEEDISVNDVCQKVGYINVSYFIKIFQKYTGVTPTRYRAESQGQESGQNQA